MYDFSALYEATSVQNAVDLMQAHPSAVLIAGGSDVLIKMREGKLAGAELISLFKLDELREVTMDPDGSLRIGPMTSFSHATKSPLLQQYMPVLGEAADTAGGPQLRSIGTLGGNICNGVTSADTASTEVAYDAMLEITGKDGMRKISIHDFYKGVGKVDLAPGELLTGILIPKESYENCFGYYIKYAMRNAMDIATIGCSVNVVLSADKKNDPADAYLLWRCGPGAHARALGRGRHQRSACERINHPTLGRCRTGRRKPAHQLARERGLPQADHQRDRAPRLTCRHRARRRCVLIWKRNS